MAFGLSFLIPGLGQLYAGKKQRGLVVLAAAVGIYSLVGLWVMMLEQFSMSQGSRTILAWVLAHPVKLGLSGLDVIWLMVLAWVTWIWQAVDAIWCIKKGR